MIELPKPQIEFIETEIEGCYEIRPAVIGDHRGFFAKIFHRPLWQEHDLCVDFKEEYLTYSIKGTLRGLHLQVPPMHLHKVVLCARGEVFDVAVDLRKESKTYGKHAVVRLDGKVANAVYIPAGLAHGFYVTSSDALLYYKQSSTYSPAHDTGIRWDSANIDWPDCDPILSDRDKKLPLLSDFESPFQR